MPPGSSGPPVAQSPPPSPGRSVGGSRSNAPQTRGGEPRPGPLSTRPGPLASVSDPSAVPEAEILMETSSRPRRSR